MTVVLPTPLVIIGGQICDSGMTSNGLACSILGSDGDSVAASIVSASRVG